MAIREIKTPYYYTGQGRVLLSKRNADGSPVGYMDIGRVSKLDMTVTEKQLFHFDSTEQEGSLDKVHHLETRVNLEINVESMDADNLALFYDGQVIEKEAGVGYEKSIIVTPGFSYACDHVNVSNFVMENDAGNVTFDVDTNYTVDEASGGFTILKDQSQAANLISVDTLIKVVYDHTIQKEIEPFSGSREEYRLRFEGLNTSEGDSPVVLECFRVSRSMLNRLAHVSGRVIQAEVSMSLLQDETQYNGNQFFREMVVQ